MTCLAARSLGADAKPKGILFSGGFEDPDFANRGWYDGSQFRIVRDARGDQDCMEYESKDVIRIRWSTKYSLRAEPPGDLQAGHPLDTFAVVLVQTVDGDLEDLQPALGPIAIERL